MKREVTVTLSAAALSLALLWSGQSIAQTQENENNQATNNNQATTSQIQSNDMVRGLVALTKPLDAKKMKPGTEFQAKLEDTVHLKNGTELPRGSELTGKVATDDMNQTGTSKLALCFTQAKLKNGNTLPIHATIMEVYPPRQFDGYGSGAMEGGAQVPNAGSASIPNTLKVDQINAINGVDLHSNINSRNSGVFVTTKNDDVKLKEGDQLALAISSETNGNTAQNNGTGAR
jgi:hypothetical protein